MAISATTRKHHANAGNGKWTFLTNHAHVLLCIARKPSTLIRDLAGLVGITERAVQGIIADLEADGYVAHERRGRCNRYKVHSGQHMRHPVERHRRISTLMELVGGRNGAGTRSRKSQE